MKSLYSKITVTNEIIMSFYTGFFIAQSNFSFLLKFDLNIWYYYDNDKGNKLRLFLFNLAILIPFILTSNLLIRIYKKPMSY